MTAAIPLLLFLSAAISAAAQGNLNTRIILGSTLTPIINTTWLSPSGVFGFGFRPTLDGYVVGTIFDRFIDKTMVWTANRKNPIVPGNLLLVLTRDGLVLKESYVQHIYSVVACSSQPTAWASMLDNGNFVLYNSSGSVIWQSFDHPTDNLLPGQRLPPEGELISQASVTDFRTGTSRLKMQGDGNLVLYYVESLNQPGDSYYSSGTYEIGRNVSLNLENDGHLYLSDGVSIVHNLTPGGYAVDGTIYLARLDWDGIIRLYVRSLQQEDSWISIWSVTKDKCSAKGLCGINSYCTYKDQNADCKCLPGFGPFLPGQWSSGCKSNFMVDCMDKDQSSKYEMTRILNVSWEDNYYSASRGNTEESCQQGCLVDCNCIIALFKDGECRKQKLPLSYGRWYENVSDMAFVRVVLSTTVKPGSGTVLGHKKSLLRKYVITGVSLGIFGPIILSIIIYYYITRLYGWFNEGNGNKQMVDKFVLKHGSLAPKRYSSNEIKIITKSFADKLGQGGYGVVYKGKLPDGQLVAVKVLKKTKDNAEEFINEVASISRTSHVNIVNLLGFCYERKKKALVYEFMPNKSLDKFIYRSRSVDPECSLEWKKLYEIAVGVALGLEYLHRGCNTRIVHFDIKPQNILLDQDFCPKISDFGLAKLCVKKQSVISMLGTRGTIGYIAPEVFSRNFGVVSHKSDVYSYGIMLLQMAEARTNVEIKSIQSSENYFLEKIYQQVVVQNQKIYGVMTEEEEEAVRKMLMVGFWCIQTAPLERPSMNNVVDMLEGNLQSIQIPPLPFLLSSPKPHDLSLLPITVDTLSSNEVSYADC